MKKIKKNTTQFTVDLTDVNSCADVYDKIIDAKIKNNINVTPLELVTQVRFALSKLTEDYILLPKDFFTCKVTVVKDKSNKTDDKKQVRRKEGLFKRFWNWITRKK